MGNKHLFRSIIGTLFPKADAENSHRAPAYARSPRQALAQYAATGCMNATFYASAERQLDQVVALARANDPAFVARAAVYSREKSFMKDLPAVLCAILSQSAPELLTAIFPRVIDDGKMLRTFVQIVRSGATGRKSLGSLPKRLVREWLSARSEEDLFRASVGRSPSLADVVKMVHPKPATPERAAIYGYLLDRAHDAQKLPGLVRYFEAYKAAAAGGAKVGRAPAVPFQMLTALDLGTDEWTEIARHASWTMTRMNLNTFARHGVFDRVSVTKMIAARLRDPELVVKARVFPYQLLMAYRAADGVPTIVKDALHDAMEIAIRNVPAIDGQIYVCPDVSGSMSSPVTGYREGSTSQVRCVDVAALVAAAVLRKNPTSEVIPFEEAVVKLKLEPRDSIMTNAERLASVGGGGTSCSAPLAQLNRQKARGDLVIYVSDNESWVDAKGRRGTELMREWRAFKARNGSAKLVCIDIQPGATTQAAEVEDVLNVGGFSDNVFEVVSAFAKGSSGANAWVKEIEQVTLS